MNKHLLLLLLGLVAIGGCASSKDTAADEAPPFWLGAFEDFDADQYSDVIPPVDSVDTEHEIPDWLKSKASVGASRVRGFRVQLFSSLSRSDANEAMQRAISWWEDQSDRTEARPPIYMEYEQPYYKVRVGNFRSRDAAARTAGRLGRVFAGAFVVPSFIETG